MQSWVDLDRDLVVRVKHMVVEALGAVRSLDMALEVTRQSLQWADHLIERFESVNSLPNPIACHLGCSFCCHNEVEVTPPEVFLIAQVILQYFPPQRQERLKEKILLSAALKFGKSKEELAATRQSRPCPLLEEDKCVVYPWRPLTCRAMHSLDREHCRTSQAAAPHQVVQPLPGRVVPGCLHGQTSVDDTDEVDFVTLVLQLSRHLQADGAAEAEADETVGTFRLDLPELVDVARRHGRHRIERLGHSVEADRLQPVDRLVGTEPFGQFAVYEDLAPVAVDGGDGWLGAVRLDRCE